MEPKILIVDNTIDTPWRLCADFRRYLDGTVVVRRAPQGDLPRSLDGFSHVILTGSKTSILDSSAWVMRLMEFVRAIAERKVPLLGVCYGHQIIARSFGGDDVVRRSPTPEFGWSSIEKVGNHPLLDELPKTFHSFQFHFEEVQRLPEGFEVSAFNDRCGVQAYRARFGPIFGVQFHPERNHEEGELALRLKSKGLPKDCIFNPGKADSLFKEAIAKTIFSKFLAIQGTDE